MHILPTRYLITVVIAVAVILCAVWFLGGVTVFGKVGPVVYGFVIGYAVAFTHSRMRERRGKIRS